MKIIEKVGKMHCDYCKIDLEVPKDGKYKIISENTCPLDGYQVVSFTSNHEPYVTSNICPNCYSNG